MALRFCASIVFRLFFHAFPIYQWMKRSNDTGVTLITNVLQTIVRKLAEGKNKLTNLSVWQTLMTLWWEMHWLRDFENLYIYFNCLGWYFWYLDLQLPGIQPVFIDKELL